MALTQINPQDFETKPFNLIANDWLLVTAEKPDGTINTLTASWGGLGFIWRRDVVFLFIRDSRYTKEFIDAANKFSICSFGGQYKKEMSFLGTVSGRNVPDKIEKSGLSITHIDGYPCFAEATFTALCDNLCATVLEPEHFFNDPQILNGWYTRPDYHTMYIGGINKLFVQK